MPGKIPKPFIDDLLTRVDIVDVVNTRVPLKKAGHEYKACCPFHDEKTPSFTVSPVKQFYHCFGCGAHGTAISFLMDYDRLSFPEAIEALAESVGIEVPREAQENRGPDLSPLYETLEMAARFYAWQLRKHPRAASAVEYLRRRGVTGAVAAEYRLGYAPPGWDNLLRELGDTQDNVKRLVATGLVSEPGDGKRYDRLRDRIVFPIVDARGRVVGFGGRVLGDGTPKYLNSPETPVFHKGRELYGLHEAKRNDKALQRLLVVEGYMDVVALAQFGIRNAVATLGTATTSDHLEKLYRIVPELVFCFDGDRAGRDAAWKALETALPLMRGGRQARFLFLPEGEDPDSLVRAQGPERMRERITGGLPLSEFLFQRLAESVDMTSLDGRARLAELAQALISRVPSGVFRDLLEQRLGELVGMTRQETRAPRPRSRPPRGGQARPRSLMQQIIALVLQHPGATAAVTLPTDVARGDIPGAALLRELLETLAQTPQLSTAALVERAESPESRAALAKLAVAPLELLPGIDVTRQLNDALDRLAAQVRKAELAALAAKPLDSLTDLEKQRLRELSRQLAGAGANPGALEKPRPAGYNG